MIADNRCTDCGVPVAAAPVAIRVVGRDQLGGVVELCPRCHFKRGAEAEATAAKLRARRTS